MARKREDVVFSVGADASPYRKTLKGVQRYTQKVGAEIQTGLRGLQVSAKSTIAAIVGVAASITALAKSQLSFADNLQKTADATDVTIEGLQKLRYVGSNAAGLGSDQVDTAIQRFSRRIGEAANGTGVLYKELQALKIELRDADGNMRSTEDILYDYADAVAAAESGQEQLRLTVAAMDTEGARFVNGLRLGGAAMKEMGENGAELSDILDSKTTRAASELNQALSDFSTKIAGNFRANVIRIAVAIDKLAGNYRNANDAQMRINELTDELARKRKAMAESWTEMGRLWEQHGMTAINEEIEALEKVVAAHKEANAERKNRIDVDAAMKNKPPPPAKPKAAKPLGGDVDLAAERASNLYLYQQGQRSRAEFEARDDEISAAGRGQALGDDERAAASHRRSAGGFGSETNTGAGAFFGTQAELDAYLKGAAEKFGGELSDAIDLAVFKPRVLPIVPGISAGAGELQTESDQKGAST